MEPDKTLGQIAFEAYVLDIGGLTYDGKPIPSWDNLTDRVRKAWEMAAIAVMNRLLLGGSVEKSE